MLTGCAPKSESVELVYRFVPTGEYPTIEEYVNHLNEDCDDLPYYMLDDNDYAHMMARVSMMIGCREQERKIGIMRRSWIH